MACIKEIMCNAMKEIFKIRSCIEILANDIEVNTTDQYMLYR